MEEKIIKILTELRPEFDFRQKVDFSAEGMLDSFDIVSLVDAIENEFDVQISGTDVIPENFNSVESILKTIQNSHK